MKMFRRITIGMVLAGVAGPGLAATANQDDLAQCKSELKRVYGEDTRLKLKSIKKKRDGNQMRIQAIGGGASHMATCWVDREGVTNMIDKDGVALIAPEFEGGNQVTQN